MMYSPFRHIDSIFWKKTPIQLTFFLTRRCNARCPFCFYLSREEVRKNTEAELTLDEIEKMSSSLGNLLWLAFSGGEVFLREDLAAVVQIFYRQNKPSLILLPTNGLLPEVVYKQTMSILENCPKSVVTLKLSLDGFEEMHDQLRGVSGAFEKFLATYNLLSGLVEKFENFELGINTVFCSLNQDSIEDIIKYVNGLEAVKTHTVSMIRGEVRDPELKKVDQEKYRRIISVMESNLRSKQASMYRFRGGKLKAAQDIVQRHLIYRTKNEETQLIPCYAGHLTLVVTESGDVFPCESFHERMGNVRETCYDLKRIISSQEGASILETISQKQCFCTHECYMMMNILFNPRIYPHVLREFLKLTG